MKLFNKDGIEMMEVRSIAYERERLVVKGKMMGAMATTIHVAPEDMWRAFQLFPARLIIRLPILLLQGRRRVRQAEASTATK